jgi:Ca2+-binding EF-hand superfamily protein
MAMKKTIGSVLAAAALLAVATPAFADADLQARVSKRVEQAFARLDSDHDGRISRAEAAKGPKMARTFDKVDADHDGFVNRAELSAAVEHRMARHQQKPPAPGPAPAPAPR